MASTSLELYPEGLMTVVRASPITSYCPWVLTGDSIVVPNRLPERA